MPKVLIAVDETDASGRVAEFVNDFFAGLDVELLGLNVGATPASWIPPSVAWGSPYLWMYQPRPDVTAETADVERTERQRAEAKVVQSGLEDAEAITAFGDAAEAIQRVADDRDVDLIVVGSTHKNVLERLVSPSVSRELVGRADRSVLVVP